MENTPRLKTEYVENVRDELQKELKLDNVMQVPTLKKIVINVGLGEATDDKGVIEPIVDQLTQISGQKPVVSKARKAIAGFKLRKGDVVGVTVTVRGNRMWELFDKIVNVALPRTKDFRGLPANAFDGNGNYTIGIKEQTIFPEIDPNSVSKLKGMEVTLVTSTRDDELSRAFLNKFGFPFANNG